MAWGIDSFVNEYTRLASRSQVREGDVEAVRTWLRNHKDAIHDPEAAYMMNEEHYDDLIPVNPKPRSWFRKVLERTYLLTTPPLSWYSPENLVIVISYKKIKTVFGITRHVSNDFRLA